jgi:hypothetical protein
LDDLIVGAYQADPNGNHSGKSYVVFGKTNSCAINLSIIDHVQFKWLKIIKSIFEKTGLNYLWNQQQPVHSVQLKFIVQMTNTFFSGSNRPSSSFYWKFNVIASKICYHVSLMW